MGGEAEATATEAVGAGGKRLYPMTTPMSETSVAQPTPEETTGKECSSLVNALCVGFAIKTLGVNIGTCCGCSRGWSQTPRRRGIGGGG